jgi:hypothetical protein
MNLGMVLGRISKESNGSLCRTEIKQLQGRLGRSSGGTPIIKEERGRLSQGFRALLGGDLVLFLSHDTYKFY